LTTEDVEPENTDGYPQLQVNQQRVSLGSEDRVGVCQNCGIALLTAGLCPPGRYILHYALDIDVDANFVVPVEREVVVFEEGRLEVEMTYQVTTGEVLFMGVPSGQLPQVIVKYFLSVVFLSVD
jgi:hypothetical protein